MNALVLKKRGRTAVWGFALGTVMILGGCVGAFDPTTDPSSPLAPRIQHMVDENRHYPSWSDFPHGGSPLPPAAQVANDVARLQARNTALTSETARIDWALTSDPSAFVNQTMRRLDTSQMSPNDLKTPAEIEAYAEALRRRAKAPPPIDRPRF